MSATDRSENQPSLDQPRPPVLPRSTDALSTIDEGPTPAYGSPPPPQELPVTRFELLEEIARGGMGVVRRCRDHHLHRDLAVKVLHERLRDLPAIARRFLEEAQITGQLQHPGIVPIHEQGTLLDGRPFFAMKLIHGRTLADLLNERPNRSHERQRFLNVFLQVCQAVAFAHSKGVIHRDLKPANVMVGAFGEVQVMDWGLAKVLTRPAVERSGSLVCPQFTSEPLVSAADTATQAGAVMGTFGYMPPEQARGEQVDERADVFSLGAMLGEVLTGRPPYTGRNREALWSKSRQAELGEAFARLDACGADADLTALAKRCLAAEQDARPRHAGEVAQALVAYLAEVEERARQAELERAAAEARAAEERKRRRVTAALAGAVLLFVGAAAAAMLWYQSDRGMALA